jgi:hypothetical protein
MSAPKMNGPVREFFTVFVSAASDGSIGSVAAAPASSAEFLMNCRREILFSMR